MLEYEGWGNPSQMILTNSDDVVHHVHPDVDDHNADHHHHQHHHGIDIFNTTTTDNNNNSNNVSGSVLSLDYTHHHHTNTFSNNNYHFFNNNSSNHIHHHHHPLYDTRSFSSYNPFDNIANNSTHQSSYFLVPKLEEGSSSIISRHGGGGGGATGTTRIGLNLGHRTYFSAQDDDFVNRLYRRSRPGGGGMEGVVVGGMVNSPRCQAEGCAADLSNAKHYHRRHKVCEFHSKAATVIAGGLTQRFCQQCSRFHLLAEFDNGKRSCRKRLADHNRRRRKTPQLPSPSSSTSQSQLELQKSPVQTSFNNLESPPESSAMTHLSSSSVTIAISPPRMSLECFRQRSFREMASTSSSSSVFYSN